MTELNVRVAQPEEIHDIMELALMVAEENGLTEPDPIKILQDVWGALNLDRGLIGVIGEEGHKPEAVILLKIESLWYSRKLSLVERAIFVHPSYRSARGGRAARLCKFAKLTAAQLDLPLIIGILSTERTEGKVRLYEREFGSPSGAYWIVGAHTGGHSIAKPDDPPLAAASQIGG
jgi:hypothetical protein